MNLRLLKQSFEDVSSWVFQECFCKVIASSLLAEQKDELFSIMAFSNPLHCERKTSSIKSSNKVYFIKISGTSDQCLIFYRIIIFHALANPSPTPSLNCFLKQRNIYCTAWLRLRKGLKK